jgi:hypothetical protein
MARYYTEAELSRRYQPADKMTFARGSYVMTAETAKKFSFDLVDLDRATGTYSRVQSDPSLERRLITEAIARERMRAPMEPSLGNRLR